VAALALALDTEERTKNGLRSQATAAYADLAWSRRRARRKCSACCADAERDRKTTSNRHSPGKEGHCQLTPGLTGPSATFGNLTD